MCCVRPLWGQRAVPHTLPTDRLNNGKGKQLATARSRCFIEVVSPCRCWVCPSIGCRERRVDLREERTQHRCSDCTQSLLYWMCIRLHHRPHYDHAVYYLAHPRLLPSTSLWWLDVSVIFMLDPLLATLSVRDVAPSRDVCHGPCHGTQMTASWWSPFFFKV